MNALPAVHGSRKTRAASFLTGGAEALSPAANLAVYDAALASDDLSLSLHVVLSSVEKALEATARALLVCQPPSPGRLAIRWWRTSGPPGLLRTPVLVRVERRGKALIPKRITARNRGAGPRNESAFGLNADLVPRLLDAYWDLYAEWKDLTGLWWDFRRWKRKERPRVKRAQAMTGTAEAGAAAIERTARERLDAMGYDTTWLDRSATGA